MFNTIFHKENVKLFFRKIVNGVIYQNKNFPNTICEEKIDSSYYALFMGMDAIIKYIIIVEDEVYFDEYLTQVELLLRKVDNHNEIVSGINKLLMNCCKMKLGIKDINENQNKEEILKYVYRKYIVEGYYFHSFPSVFLEDVMHHGLKVDSYNYELDSLKEINEVFKKYNLNHIFSKDFEPPYSYISACDCPFMGCFYAYHSPYFLNEICTDLIEKNKNYLLDPLFKKDYLKCKKNLSYFMKKKGMFHNDINEINNFFAKEWDLFHINDSVPIMCIIKRRDLEINDLTDINKIIESSKDTDLLTSITKILETKDNHFEIKQNVLPQSFEILYLPTLEELGFEVIEENKKQKEENLPVMDNSDNSIMNEYGNITIIALLGVLLIVTGITITLIMLGR